MIVFTNTPVTMNRVITLTSAMVTIAIIGIPRPTATAKMYESIITLLVLNSFCPNFVRNARKNVHIIIKHLYRICTLVQYTSQVDWQEPVTVITGELLLSDTVLIYLGGSTHVQSRHKSPSTEIKTPTYPINAQSATLFEFKRTPLTAEV